MTMNKTSKKNQNLQMYRIDLDNIHNFLQQIKIIKMIKIQSNSLKNKCNNFQQKNKQINNNINKKINKKYNKKQYKHPKIHFMI